MIEVRIRQEADMWVDSIHIGEWPSDKLDDILRDIGRWGIVGEHDDVANTDRLSGQFVVWQGEAWFEVVIHPID